MTNERDIHIDLDSVQALGEIYSASWSRSTVPHEVLAALRDGSHEAYETVFLQWRKPIYSLLFKLTGSRHYAEDITHDVFIRLWENRHRIDPSRNVKALLYLISRQMTLKHIARRQLHDLSDNELDFERIVHENSLDILVAKEVELLKEMALSRMPDQQSRIWRMNTDNGLTPKQIAHELGLSVKTVYNQLSMVRQQLKDVVVALLVFFGLEAG